MSYCINIPKQSPTTYTCRGFPKVKSCGNANPYYISQDFYYSEGLGRNISRCQVEDYWEKYLTQGIDLNPNKKIVPYYRKIVAYIRPLYFRSINEFGYRYSKLSKECTAVLIIKRVLSKKFSQEEVAKIITLFGIDQTICNC